MTCLRIDEDSIDATNYNFLVQSQGGASVVSNLANYKAGHNLSFRVSDLGKPNPFRVKLPEFETSNEIGCSRSPSHESNGVSLDLIIFAKLVLISNVIVGRKFGKTAWHASQ